MKKSIGKIFVTFAIAAVIVASFTSCSRGMGCPNNFSLTEKTVDIFKSALESTVKDLN